MKCKNCEKLLRELPAKWYQKGQESVKRENQSGCCCIIDDGDKIVEVCAAHLAWREPLKQALKVIRVWANYDLKFGSQLQLELNLRSIVNLCDKTLRKEQKNETKTKSLC